MAFDGVTVAALVAELNEKLQNGRYIKLPRRKRTN